MPRGIKCYNKKETKYSKIFWIHINIRKYIQNKSNINGGDVQRKNVVNNVDKSSLLAPWQNGPYKNTQNITKHGVNKDATDIKK